MRQLVFFVQQGKFSTRMRATSHLLKKSPSSSRWLQRQGQDPYVRQRTVGGLDKADSDTYRSRSAFKLVSLAQRYPSLLGRGKVVVDLGAAPGGWSQVAVNKGSRVIAVDLLDMEPIKRVDFIQGNFLDYSVQQQVAELASKGGRGGECKVDTVLSDMMASMTGVRSRDVQASLDLVTAATSFGIQTLRKAEEREHTESDILGHAGGSMVLKFFMHPDLDDFRRTELVPRFNKVVIDKPKESRKESSEAYFVCLGYKG